MSNAVRDGERGAIEQPERHVHPRGDINTVSHEAAVKGCVVMATHELNNIGTSNYSIVLGEDWIAAIRNSSKANTQKSSQAEGQMHRECRQFPVQNGWKAMAFAAFLFQLDSFL
jgi:hypothetical protein